MIPPADAWGPFAPNLELAEQIGRLRCLTTIAHLSCGPRGADLIGALKASETNPRMLPVALAALDNLAPLDRRRVLASYAALNAPARQPRGSSNTGDRP